jgi:hypothetical protein
LNYLSISPLAYPELPSSPTTKFGATPPTAASSTSPSTSFAWIARSSKKERKEEKPIDGEGLGAWKLDMGDFETVDIESAGGGIALKKGRKGKNTLLVSNGGLRGSS